jgi:hypothetical protein
MNKAFENRPLLFQYNDLQPLHEDRVMSRSSISVPEQSQE